MSEDSTTVSSSQLLFPLMCYFLQEKLFFKPVTTATAQHAERGKGKPGKPGKPSKHHDSDEVNLFEALRIISGRYEDLQIKKFDDSRYLRKKIEKFSRKIYKKVNQLDQNGCIIYERDNDLKEKISKQDVASFHSAGAKLKQDMNEILNYFTGEEKKKCRKFKNGTVKKIDAVCNYIDSYGFHIIILFWSYLEHLRVAF